MNIPTEDQKRMTLSRLQRHVEHLKLRRRGVEIVRISKASFSSWRRFQQAKSGLLGRVLGTASLKGVAKIGRLEFLGPNLWRPLIFKSDTNKYGPHSAVSEGTIEECLAGVVKVFF